MVVLLLLFCLLCLVLFPQIAADAVRSGLTLCVRTVLPALFPYLILSDFAVKKGIGGKRSSTLPVILGTLGGYPLGAKTAISLYRQGRLTREDCKRLLFFCSNAGPSFLFGIIAGTLYRSLSVGLTLWGIHLLAALILRCFRRSKPSMESMAPQASVSTMDAAFSAVQNAGKAAAAIGLFIVAFAVPMAYLKRLLAPFPTVSLICGGLLELSAGCCAVAESALSFPWKFVLTALFLGWGGCCIHGQTAILLKDRELFFTYLCGKALHGLISAALAVPVVLLLPSVTPAFASHHSPPRMILSLLPIIFLFFLQITSGILQKHRL